MPSKKVNLLNGFAITDGWTTEDMVLLWKDSDPVQITRSLFLPKFNLEKYNTDYCNSRTNTGEFAWRWSRDFSVLFGGCDELFREDQFLGLAWRIVRVGLFMWTRFGSTLSSIAAMIPSDSVYLSNS